MVLLSMLLPGVAAQAGSERRHLRFFHENREFILRSWEKLPREGAPPEDRARAWDFDPFAAWSVRNSVEHVRASLDTATTPEHLGEFHAALDGLLEEAASAGARLDDLDHRFSAHLRTSLEVTLATGPDVEVQRVEAWLDGQQSVAHDLTGAERAALAAGGVLEVLRRVVEPRQQDLEVRAWIRGRDEPTTTRQVVSPKPDALVRLHLQVARADEPARLMQSTFGGSP